MLMYVATVDVNEGLVQVMPLAASIVRRISSVTCGGADAVGLVNEGVRRGPRCWAHR